ncbi:autotransporter domain-containing protein [Camelimonas fluminis]|uniref:Autotransporter domain-containing protein n=1 Tax=Camelimonas fluminis TaxID=1576911 RepID=A0ABV7UM83_9HYPH|nr:autotransporter domain-containing protein [Camelimonas fluminis]
MDKDLLSEIRDGVRLKPAPTNDQMAPAPGKPGQRGVNAPAGSNNTDLMGALAAAIAARSNANQGANGAGSALESPASDPHAGAGWNRGHGSVASDATASDSDDNNAADDAEWEEEDNAYARIQAPQKVADLLARAANRGGGEQRFNRPPSPSSQQAENLEVPATNPSASPQAAAPAQTTTTVTQPGCPAELKQMLEARRAAMRNKAPDDSDDEDDARQQAAPAAIAAPSPTGSVVISRPTNLGLGNGVSPVNAANTTPLTETPDFPPPPPWVLPPVGNVSITPVTPPSVVQAPVIAPVGIVADANGNMVIRHEDNATHDYNGPVALKCDNGACIEVTGADTNVIIRGNAVAFGRDNEGPLVIADNAAVLTVAGPVTLTADARNAPVIEASTAGVINFGPTTIFLPAGGLDAQPVIAASDAARIHVDGKLTLPKTYGETIVEAAEHGSVTLANAAGVANAIMRGQIGSVLNAGAPLVRITGEGSVTIQGHDIVADAGNLFENEQGSVINFGAGGGKLVLHASDMQLDNGHSGHTLVHIDGAARAASIQATDSKLSALGDSMLVLAEVDATFAGRRVTLLGDIVGYNAPAIDLTLADNSHWTGDLIVDNGVGNLALTDDSYWKGDFHTSESANTASLSTSSWIGSAFLGDASELSVKLVNNGLWSGDMKPEARSASDVKLTAQLSGESVWVGNINASDNARIRVKLDSDSKWLGHARVTDNADIGVSLHDSKWTGDIEATDNARIKTRLQGMSDLSGVFNVGDKALLDVTMNEGARWIGGVIAANDATIDLQIAGNGKFAGGMDVKDNARIMVDLTEAGDWDGSVLAGKNAAIAVRLNDKAAWKGRIVAPDAQAAIVMLDGRSRWEGQGFATSIDLASPDARWNLTGNTHVRDQVLNAGMINLAHTPGAILRTGTYNGADGRIAMAVNLDDAKNSKGNKLIFTQRADGRTTLDVTATGAGGPTTGAGLPVVIAANNQATSTDDAFVLAAPVTAGAHVYALYKGADAAAGERVQNSWHLRSTKLIAPAPAPAPVPAPAPAPAARTPAAPAPVAPAPVAPGGPGAGSPASVDSAPAPVGVASAPVVSGRGFGPDAIPVQATAQGYELPMYRVETPLYGAVPDLARTLSTLTAGSRADRMGAVRAQNGGVAGREGASGEAWIGAWARMLGGVLTEGASLSQTPSVNGAYGGLQAGADLLGYSTPFHEGRFGVFGGHATANTRIRGFAEGAINMAVGSLSVDAASGGVYWTHTGPGGVYVDATVAGSRYQASGKSVRGGGVKVTGHGVTVTVEAGAPLQLGGGFTLEPQAQIIWRMLHLNPLNDRFAHINYRTRNSTRVRFGGRLSWDGKIGDVVVKPFIQAGLWRQTGKVDRVIYNGVTSIPSAIATRGVDLDAGLEVIPTGALSLWASAGASMDLDRSGGRTSRRSWRGKAGLRYQW